MKNTLGRITAIDRNKDAVKEAFIQNKLETKAEIKQSTKKIPQLANAIEPKPALTPLEVTILENKAKETMDTRLESASIESPIVISQPTVAAATPKTSTDDQSAQSKPKQKTSLGVQWIVILSIVVLLLLAFMVKQKLSK